jgi:hypothetical protein
MRDPADPGIVVPALGVPGIDVSDEDLETLAICRPPEVVETGCLDRLFHERVG